MMSSSTDAILRAVPEIPDEALVRRHGADLESLGAEELLGWALDRWGDRLVICTALQVTGMVIVDLAWRIEPAVRVMTLDTGRLPQETHELVERVRDRYGIEVDVRLPDPEAVGRMVRSEGPNLFYRSAAARRRCCRIRKVEPLRRALAGFEAWVAGLRRDQSAERAGTPKVQLDPATGVVKLHPLVDWTEAEVWNYVRDRDVPCHALYDRGYTSIGCAPCTRPLEPGEDARAGRWWWEGAETRKECGLHVAQGGGPPCGRGDGADADAEPGCGPTALAAPDGAGRGR